MWKRREKDFVNSKNGTKKSGPKSLTSTLGRETVLNAHSYPRWYFFFVFFLVLFLLRWRGNTGELRFSKAHVDLWCMVNPTAWAEFQLCLHITPCEESHLLISVDVVEGNPTIGHCGGTVDWICVAFSLPSFPVQVFKLLMNTMWLRMNTGTFQ